MVDFNEFMSIGLSKCAPSGTSQRRRRQVFKGLVSKWQNNEDRIRQMSASELRREITCP